MQSEDSASMHEYEFGCISMQLRVKRFIAGSRVIGNKSGMQPEAARSLCNSQFPPGETMKSRWPAATYINTSSSISRQHTLNPDSLE